MKASIPVRFIFFTSLFLLIEVSVNPATAFSQGHEGHAVQSIPPGNTEKTDSQGVEAAAQDQEIPMVEITPEQQQLIGVKTVKAAMNPFVKVIRTVGLIETNERNLATVNAKIEGWIEKLYVDYTGAYVKKGEPLAELYSPELLATQMEFINALKWTGKEPSAVQAQEAGDESLDNTISPAGSASELQNMLKEDAAEIIDAGRQRLRLWDMSEAQIAEIEETGKPIRTLILYSPVGGYVTEKMAVLGTKVMPGEKLFDVADLSSLWVIADIYEYELPFVKVGQEARITLNYAADKELRAKIDYIYPVVSRDTRTAKVRLTLQNPGGQLKPQMYTNVEISIDLGNRLTIPESSVIDTGEMQVVYVDLGDGNFEPREVQLGLRAGGFAEVLKGLTEGEDVAYAANFLIDSEAQLRGVKPLSSK